VTVPNAADRRRSAGPSAPSVVALCILVASLIPVPSAGTVAVTAGALPAGIDLTTPFHLVGYAVLAALVARTTGGTRRGFLAAVATVAAFGLGVELAQAPVPWRSFAWADAGINAIGAFVGAAVHSIRQTSSAAPR